MSTLVAANHPERLPPSLSITTRGPERVRGCRPSPLRMFLSLPSGARHAGPPRARARPWTAAPARHV
eukprot:6205636-Pleurochrysis_carterae.AAC.9